MPTSGNQIVLPSNIKTNITNDEYEQDEDDQFMKDAEGIGALNIAKSYTSDSQ